MALGALRTPSIRQASAPVGTPQSAILQATPSRLRQGWLRPDLHRCCHLHQLVVLHSGLLGDPIRLLGLHHHSRFDFA